MHEVRHHSSDEMVAVTELTATAGPVGVVIRPDGSVDVYGYVGIVDQRGDDRRSHQFGEQPDDVYPRLTRAHCSCGWTSGGYSRIARTFWEQHVAAVTS
jgi:hypothetical protein